MERKKRVLTGLAVTGVLAGALAGGGVVLAGTSGASQTAAVTTAASGTAASGLTSTSTSTSPGARPHAARYLRRHHAGRLVLRTSASYLGLTPEQLRTDLKAGKSLSAIAVAQGKSASGLENAIVAAADKRIDASKLPAARKAAITGDVKDNVDKFVDATHPFKKAALRLGHKAGAAGSSAASPAATSAATSAAQPA